VIATQGRAIWILDDLSPLHQLGREVSAAAPHLFRPRDGYRTRSGAAQLGPTLQYYLPSAPAAAVRLEILDTAGKPVNSYTSEGPAPPPVRAASNESIDPDMAPSRFRAAPPSRTTKLPGINRFVWDLRHSSGVTVPPGTYQARLTLGATVLTQPFTVRIDPRVAEEGVTVADLTEQFEHNLRMRELVTRAGRAAVRVQGALTRLKGASGAAADTLARVQAIAGKLLTEPVRYGKPGLQAHITYLNGMTNGADQKIGRDAIARYEVLKREFDALDAELTQVLGPAQTSP
jgi:hypothetical protein